MNRYILTSIVLCYTIAASTTKEINYTFEMQPWINRLTVVASDINALRQESPTQYNNILPNTITTNSIIYDNTAVYDTAQTRVRIDSLADCSPRFVFNLSTKGTVCIALVTVSPIDNQSILQLHICFEASLLGTNKSCSSKRRKILEKLFERISAKLQGINPDHICLVIESDLDLPNLFITLK